MTEMTEADSAQAAPLGWAGRRRGGRSDAALVRAARAGSEDAVAELFGRHWPAAHRAAWLVTRDGAGAEDVAQEAFVAAMRALDRFDRRRPFAPWLHRIVVNRAIDWTRARAVRAEVAEGGEPVALDEPGAATRPSEDVLAALAALAPEQRAVVVLRHLLDYGPGEIATILDLPRGTVNSRLRRALDALSAALEEERP
jgi:RNA polymerase sigma-70 factor (ECF subfamily)